MQRTACRLGQSGTQRIEVHAAARAIISIRGGGIKGG